MNTIYTDTQLKKTLAQMLPDQLTIEESNPFPPTLDEAVDNPSQPVLMLKAKLYNDWRPVLDTELLYLCWLLEETLDTVGDLEEPPELRASQASEYVCFLAQDYEFQSIHATWQQKVIAIAKMKGVEIV
jgi:hypothetical protein